MTDKHEGLRLGIVNPMTLVSRELKTILRERGVPYESIRLIDTTGEHKGELTDVGDEATFIAAADENAFFDLDIVFFCGPADANAPWISRYDEDRFAAVDLAQPASSEGIAIVAGVNTNQITRDTHLIVSPHPVATPLILLLNEIRKRSPIDIAAASVIQPASEFDQKGIDELFQQTIAVLNVQDPPRAIFGRQLAFNLYPAENANALEAHVLQQAREILGHDLPLSISITQGTLFHNHMFNLFVKTAKPVSQREAIEALNASIAIHVGDQDDEPYSSVDAAAKDEVIVGRVRVDPSIENALWIWAACDNVRRASALNAVLIAERLIELLGERVN